MKDSIPSYINILAGALMMFFAFIIWLYTTEFPQLDEGYPGPSLFPRMIASSLAIAGLIIIIQGFRSWKRSLLKDTKPVNGDALYPYLRLGLGLLAVGLYPLLKPWIGFIPSISLVCFSLALLMKIRIKIALPVAVITALALYSIFYYLLGVSL